jgi:hypothetical protein
MRNWIAKLALLVLFLSAPAFLLAQDVATLNGLVKDSTGALVPGTSVVLSNPSTGSKYTTTTNSEGFYRFTEIPAGPGYKVVFTHSGFAAYAVLGVYLDVANTRTQNATLLAGSTEQIEVSAVGQGVTINTEDASIGNNFEVQKLNDLPVYDRSAGITTLFALQPGVSRDGSTTGARIDQDNKTLDGLDINDFATGNFTSIEGGAPIDAVQEFRGTVAGFGTDSGPSSGGQFQMVTKSGTNRFHGDLNEYHRDRSTVANDWFNNGLGIPRVQLIRNQFGGAVGGPIKKDKLFFFFDYNMSRTARSAPQTRTVPLDSFFNGNVSYINNGLGCSDDSRQNTQANCISQLTPAQVQALDPSRIGNNPAFFALLAAAYPHANDLTLGDGVNTGGYRFNAPRPDNLSDYVGRLDYNLNSKMKIFARGSVVREDAVQTPQQFPSQPVLTAPFSDRSYAWVVGHNWVISANKVNQFSIGETVSQPSFPIVYNPQGNFPITFSSGTTTLLSDPYLSPSNAQGRRVPIPQITDNFDWQVGDHAIAFGGTFKWINSSDYTLLDYSTATIGLGGNLQNLNASLRPADLFPTVSGGSEVTYDSAYTAALGRIASLSGNFNYDSAGNALPQGTGEKRNYKYYQTQLYVGDTWKVTPHLTLSYGVNYELFSVPYEKDGLETVQQLVLPDGSTQTGGFDNFFYGYRAAQSAAGATGNSAVPFFQYVLGGKANHGPGLYSPSYNNFAPRFAFAFNPGSDPKTVFNGSAGMVYDRTIVNAVQYQQDHTSYLFSQPLAQPYGTSGQPVGSLEPFSAGGDPRLGTNSIASLVVTPATPKPPFTPYVQDGVPYGLQNGQAFNNMIDPNLKTPYSILVNFGVQHEFPGGFVFKTSYVGRFGRRLLAWADANQLIDFTDPASGQKMSTAFGNMTQALRNGAGYNTVPVQPWMENIVAPGFGAGYVDPVSGTHPYTSNTGFIADQLSSLVVKGDFADTIQALSGLLPPNVGMGAQFSENGFYTNKGFSTYQGLLTTLQKNLSHGVQFDLNYTWQHSIDNTSLEANNNASAGVGFLCDALRVRECRGTSDFDQTHIVTADFTYALPFGRGRTFASNIPWGLNEVIGGWDVSGITAWHSGTAFSTVSSAFVASYSNDAPAIFNGDKSAIRRKIHKDENGTLQLFANPTAAAAAFSGPIGFQIGSRNNLRGPQFFNQDLGLAKSFAIIPSKDVNLKFRADAFNVFNHPNFNSPGTLTNYDDITQPARFGNLTTMSDGSSSGTNGFSGITYRLLQLALRVEF